MKKALFCLIILLPLIAFAQVTEEWVARYNGLGNGEDKAEAIAVDAAGNVYVTGWSYGSDTDYDYATVKYSSDGEELWVARYDGPGNGSDGARDIAVDGSGNVYVTGRSVGSETGWDYATVKYNSSGVQQWLARYDGPGNGYDEACAIAVDGSGNVYVTGQSVGSGTGWDYATVKYSPSGAEQWVARYDGPASYGDKARAMAIDGAGNVYVTGQSKGLGTSYDYATVKYNTSGVEQWVARYDGPESGGDYAYAIAIDDAGNVYVTGRSEDSGTYYDYATVKYNSAGTEQWVARYDAAIDWDKAFAIAVDGAGNVYVTGCSKGLGTSYDYATVKYSTLGVQEWVARYDGPASSCDAANAIAIDGAGNVYVTGWSFGSGTSYDYATVKYSQGPGVAEASPDVSGHRLEVTQLTPEPTISYTLSVSTHISLKLFDVTGKLVRTLVSGSQEAGTHTVHWPVTHPKTPSGVYFVRLETSNRSATAKLVVAR